MELQKLLSLISKEEGLKLDFKEKLNIETESGKKELAKDICAIANSKGGRGYLIFGIEDKSKKIIGINKQEFNEEKIQQIISTRIEPPVPISVDTVDFNGKTIGIITIFNTDQKPFQLRETGAFYIRRGSTTDYMRRDEIASIFQDVGLLSIDQTPVIKSKLKDLDFDKIMEFFKLSGINSPVDNHLLISAGIASKINDSNEIHPTIGGMLLFGKNPDIFLPYAIIIIHNYINNCLPKIYISKGTILDMLKNAINFINNIYNDILLRAVIQDYLCKAVIYRDYFCINRCIEVYIKNNKIEIVNPGAAIKVNNKYIKHNLWLYSKLLTIDKDKEFLYKNYNKQIFEKKYGKIKSYNILSDNLYKVIIPTICKNYE
ncbi:Putative DNA-binding domain-containing protein [Caloramator fervidus]|uniref:Putative DNA-binding domain-containing protein n=1 Tax=Caloramator fervidus TaxID=29344 RepID=A0A1H5SPT1_9CLOT|nr:RNA-binding domain-containing protein [Caloramator fervidus]SEF51978.1 Putative DNA-binding domain-containing protein [Caloramator fervidus]